MNGLDFVYEKSITLKELKKIKDICKNYLSGHYMSINYLSININCSTIDVFPPTNPSEIRSFVKCVLSRTQ